MSEPAPVRPAATVLLVRDGASGLYYMRARWYDPATGVFTSVDPAVAQTEAPYSYANDDPLDVVDPTGQFGILDFPVFGEPRAL